MTARPTFPPATSTRDRATSALVAFDTWLEGRSGPSIRVQRVAAHVPVAYGMPRLFIPAHQRGSSMGTRHEWYMWPRLPGAARK